MTTPNNSGQSQWKKSLQFLWYRIWHQETTSPQCKIVYQISDKKISQSSTALLSLVLGSSLPSPLPITSSLLANCPHAQSLLQSIPQGPTNRRRVNLAPRVAATAGAAAYTTRNYLICDAFSATFSENITNVHCSPEHRDDLLNSSRFYDVFLFFVTDVH
jgi:hypothetical protein